MNPDVDTYEQVYRIRSFFTSGYPVSSSWTVVNGTSVRESTYSDSEMEDLFMDWVTPFWEKLTVDEKAGLTDGDLNIIFFEEGNFDDDLMAEFITMLICFAAAIVIVGFYMCFHLKCCQDKDEEGNIMKMSFTFRRAASAMLTTQT